MELQDLERLWKEHDIKLEKTISLNEKLLRKLKLDPAIKQFDNLVKLSTWGRNLALVYSIPSIVLSIMLASEIVYSVPGLIGGLVMVLSFYYHTKTIEPVRNLNYHSMSIAGLQKIIREFRVRSLAASKYDLFTVLIWLATSIPMVCKVFFKNDVYANLQPSAINITFVIICVLVMFVLNEFMYKNIYGEVLSKAEADLNEVMEFEKNGDTSFTVNN